MVRHCHGRQELYERIRKGEIGDLTFLRAYRMGGGRRARPAPMTEREERAAVPDPALPRFLWASGGLFSDYYIHQIDECCWMKDAWPVKAHATGGRHYRGNSVDQNFDNYSVEYTFPDGTKLFFSAGRFRAATTSSPATPTAPRGWPS